MSKKIITLQVLIDGIDHDEVLDAIEGAGGIVDYLGKVEAPAKFQSMTMSEAALVMEKVSDSPEVYLPEGRDYVLAGKQQGYWFGIPSPDGKHDITAYIKTTDEGVIVDLSGEQVEGVVSHAHVFFHEVEERELVEKTPELSLFADEVEALGSNEKFFFKTKEDRDIYSQNCVAAASYMRGNVFDALKNVTQAILRNKAENESECKTVEEYIHPFYWHQLGLSAVDMELALKNFEEKVAQKFGR